MTVDFKNLEKIDEILAGVNKLLENQSKNMEKKWLSTRELAEYLDYSEDRIHKIKSFEFIEGIHYHKRSGKLLFDKNKIDHWVMGIETYDLQPINIENAVNNIFGDLLCS